MKSDKFTPLVSIIIPVYNGSNYMREAIDSALSQTYKNIEVLVINDGSRDDGATDKIAREYGDKIRYIHKENGGVSTALNTGIRNMKGDYFSWLSHDDVYTPDKVEKSVEALADAEDREHTLVCCQSIHIDKNSDVIAASVKKSSVEEKQMITWDKALIKMLKEGTMSGCALLIHRKVFDEVGLFDEDLRFRQDAFMWNKIFLKKNNMIIIPDACVKGRVHDKQLTQTGRSVFITDCESTSEFLIPQLLNISTKENNFIVEYIKYNAKYGITSVVKSAYAKAKQKKLISFSSAVKITLVRMYGKVRPLVRKVYYIVFRNIKIS